MISESLLWIPPTVKELICLNSDDFKYYEIDDNKVETFVNQAFVDWLNGQLDTGTLTDILLEYDIDPTVIDECEETVNLIQRSARK